MRKNGLNFERQKPVGVIYDDVLMDIGFIVDTIVEDKVIIEIKSIETVKAVHHK